MLFLLPTQFPDLFELRLLAIRFESVVENDGALRNPPIERHSKEDHFLLNMSYLKNTEQ
jgi:hypothetical protein